MKKTVVIKIGSSVIMTKRNKLDEYRIAHIADQIELLIKQNVGVVLVVSGAVACGSSFIDISPQDITLRSAAAGMGQAVITSAFYNIFADKQLKIAQMLLTKDFFTSRKQRENLKNILKLYIESGVIPFINENDVLDLNSFGGNDFLAARIAILLGVSKLMILSSYEKSYFGIGGEETKLEAAELAADHAIKTDIADGKIKNIILNSLL